jgi:hypothetical protein
VSFLIVVESCVLDGMRTCGREVGISWQKCRCLVANGRITSMGGILNVLPRYVRRSHGQAAWAVVCHMHRRRGGQNGDRGCQRGCSLRAFNNFWHFSHVIQKCGIQNRRACPSGLAAFLYCARSAEVKRRVESDLLCQPPTPLTCRGRGSSDRVYY